MRLRHAASVRPPIFKECIGFRNLPFCLMRLVRMEEAEFSKLAATEDRMWYFRGLHALVEWRLASAFPGATAEVLDCGCGTGGLIRRMAAVHPRWRWTGVDLSPLACAFARERTTARICEGSAMALPFDSNRFDAVVLADVLYHLDDDRKALGGMPPCPAPRRLRCRERSRPPVALVLP